MPVPNGKKSRVIALSFNYDNYIEVVSATYVAYDHELSEIEEDESDQEDTNLTVKQKIKESLLISK
jgi:hypothetical protein